MRAMFFLRNKETSKGCGARLVPPALLQYCSRSKPSASVPHPNTLPYHCTFSTQLVPSYFLYYSSYQITLFSPFPLPHCILIFFPSLVSYLLLKPSLLLQDCFHSTVAPPPLLRFNFWLPSCPGSCIANPFFFVFFYIYTPCPTCSLPSPVCPCVPCPPLSHPSRCA